MTQKCILIICFLSQDDVPHQSMAACLEASVPGSFDVPLYNITKASLLWTFKRLYTYRIQTLRYLYVEISERQEISLSFCCLVCSWISKTKWAALESAAQTATYSFLGFIVLMRLERGSLQYAYTLSSQMIPFPEDFFHLCTVWGWAQLYKCHERFSFTLCLQSGFLFPLLIHFLKPQEHGYTC